MDFSNSVIMPREDFIELSEAAWHTPPASLKMKAATTVQYTLFFVAATAAVTAGSWGIAKAMNWFEEETLKRKMRENNAHEQPVEK
jgi:hypothetical protein